MLNLVLQRILAEKRVVDDGGKSHDLVFGIDEEEGELLRTVIRKHGFCNTLEIGCAYGVSSLYICDAISHCKSPRHTIIDPQEMTGWHGIGVSNLKKAGFEFYELIEKPSEIALPALVEEGRRIDFALIDGWHTFDQTLLDFYYIDRLLVDGGIVAIDDVSMPAVNKCLRYILNYPNYKLVAAANSHQVSQPRKRRIAKAALRGIVNMLPARYLGRILEESWKRSDRSLGLDTEMVAVQKTCTNHRSWDWYIPF